MLADRMAESFYKGGIITDEEKEVIRFGLESLEGNLLGVGLTLAVGICFKQVGEALLLWLLLFPLRKNAGGYHAATKTRCLFVSAVILIAAFMIFAVFERTLIFYGICAMIAGCVIWVLAPVDNPSKQLDAVECKVYRRRTRIVLGTESVIFIFALLFKWEITIRSVCMAFSMVAISLLTGAIELAISNKIKTT